MANFERGAYEPRGGDDIPVFDGAVDEEEVEEGSRLPLLIVVALLVLAAFAGVVWLAYTQGVQRGRADAPRIIAAEPGPEKIAPANPGGTATPYTGLKIYQQPAPVDDASEAETPPPASSPSKAAAAPPATAPAVQPSLRSAANVAPEATPPAAAPTTTKPAVSPPASPAASVAPPIATHEPTKLGGARTTASVAGSAKPKAAVSQEAPAVPTEPKAAASGAYVLQIGAYKSSEEASASWDAFKARHTMAARYDSRIKKVDLGDKGIWYRLQLASFTDKDAATAFCEKLKADNGNCFVAK